MAAHLPPGSATHRATDPDGWAWGIPEQLAASLVDLTALLVWFKTKDGAKNRNRPKPVQRPGVVDDDVKTWGGRESALPMDEMAEWLGWSA